VFDLLRWTCYEDDNAQIRFVNMYIPHVYCEDVSYLRITIYEEIDATEGTIRILHDFLC